MGGKGLKVGGEDGPAKADVLVISMKLDAVARKLTWSHASGSRGLSTT